MYKVKDFEKLKEFGFKEYKSGFSKKVIGKNYDFLDVTFDDRIVKTVKIVNGNFVYEIAEKSDLADLIKGKVVKKADDCKI